MKFPSNGNAVGHLESLYKRFTCDRDSLSPEEWLWLDRELCTIARRAVRASAHRWRIPERTMDDTTEAVHALLREKFLQSKLRYDTSFSSGLRTTAFRDVVQVLRQIKSVLPGSLDAMEGSGSDIGSCVRLAPMEIADQPLMFDIVRDHFGDTRWPEYPTSRELVLAAFVIVLRPPGSDVLKIVPARDRISVYLSAIYDINTAIVKIRTDQQAA